MWSDLKNWDGGGGGGGVGRWSLGCLVSEMPGAVAVVAQFPPTSRSPTTRREAVDDPFGCRTYLAFVLDFCLFFVNYLKIGKQMTLNSLESGFN